MKKINGLFWKRDPIVKARRAEIFGRYERDR